MTSKENKQQERILIFAPTGRDADLTARFLTDANLFAEVCDGADDLCRKMAEGAGLVFLTGETLTPDAMRLLDETLRQQSPWADIPLIVLTSGGGESPSNSQTLEALAEVGNVTLIERPVRLMTLVSAIKSALRARRKQYEARDFLVAEMEAKNALRQSEERLLVALETAHLGTWELHLGSRKMECTEICKANFGLPADAEFSYDRFISLIHPDDRERVGLAVSEAVEKNENYRAEYRVVWEKNQTTHWILASGTVNYDAAGNPLNMVGVTLDITERKLVEKQREEILKNEQAARVAAESANRLKDEFLATVSHELRTPLNAMLGWTNLLRSGRLNEADAKRALDTVERNARTQSEIIEDLLDVSRIISGKLNLQIAAIEPVEMVRAAIESLKPAADAKNISVRQTTENDLGKLMGDAARIQQVIWNLLSNAIKFTPAGGSVEISLKAERENLIFAVSDTGSGIDPEFLPFVFDRFLQADGTTTRTHGGLGLGLAIVRHLVELHGGTVTAQSDGKNRGATFTVTLPLAHKSKTDSQAAKPLVQNRKELENNESCGDLMGLKVLVVDDEIDSLELIKIFLEHCGAHVQTADSADAALKSFDTIVPDVLISDIGMPGSDGYELIEKIRGFAPDRGGRIPAVALTAYARSEDKTRALRSGFQTHLTKPVEMEKLVSTISKIAGRN